MAAQKASGEVDLLAALERVIGSPLPTPPRDRRSTRDIERDERLIDRAESRRDEAEFYGRT